MDLHKLRYDYKSASLSEDDCNPNPFEQFKVWFAEAVAAKPPEPNAMIVSSVDATGQPSTRAVLLKSFDELGFVFFTNYQSRKGREISGSSKVSLLFYWGELERQVRIEGIATVTSREVSEAYFARRPRSSQLGAVCSPQSETVARAEIEALYAGAAKRFPEGTPVPCPPHWGGYVVTPHRFEFWQGRESRLHDRIEYSKHNESWAIKRLAP